MRTFGPDFEIRGSGKARWARVLWNQRKGLRGKSTHFANFWRGLKLNIRKWLGRATGGCEVGDWAGRVGFL